MLTNIKKVIKRTLLTILGWDLIKKSQLVLCYAILAELSLLLLTLGYLDHTLINISFLKEIAWLLPTLICTNIAFILLGLLLKNKHQYYVAYSSVILLYYLACLLFLHFVIGLLNIVNGVVFIGTVLAILILFPSKIIKRILWLYAFSYLILVYLTLNGYLDDALVFTPYALIHSHIEAPYVLILMSYTIFYVILIVGVASLWMEVLQDKIMLRNVKHYKDQLTTILNAKGIRKIVSLQLKQMHIAQSELSVIVLDLDNLRRVNDENGREAGDEVLKHVAEVLRKNLRSSDMIARLQGGTFVLVLAFTSLERAEAAAEMCRVAIEQTPCVHFNDRKIYVKASFGISSTQAAGFDFDCLLLASEKAMKQAKQNGKNQICSTTLMTPH